MNPRLIPILMLSGDEPIDPAYARVVPDASGFDVGGWVYRTGQAGRGPMDYRRTGEMTYRPAPGYRD